MDFNSIHNLIAEKRTEAGKHQLLSVVVAIYAFSFHFQFALHCDLICTFCVILQESASHSGWIVNWTWKPYSILVIVCRETIDTYSAYNCTICVESKGRCFIVRKHWQSLQTTCEVFVNHNNISGWCSILNQLFVFCW